MSETIDKYREQIDNVDNQIAQLYDQRMALVKNIGLEKAKSATTVLDYNREKNIINRVVKQVNPEIQLYTKQVFNELFDTSRAYQNRFVTFDSTIIKELTEVLEKPREAFPQSCTVACQGVPGSYSNIAAERLFPLNDITFFRNFDGVFTAVEKGLCQYGVLPIENSTAGSVNAVYDLMKQHKFFIVRTLKLRVQHCLLAKPGCRLEDVREIFSHEQAVNQCGEFLKLLKDVKITIVSNTAVAARMVAESPVANVAAMSSHDCAEIYNLNILKANIQDNINNYTRFICISKRLQIFHGANKISLMMNLPHTPGSLNKVLSRFNALNLSLTKLESRPIANTDFEFLFYFDFEGNIDDSNVLNLLAELDNGTEKFAFLGCYSENL